MLSVQTFQQNLLLWTRLKVRWSNQTAVFLNNWLKSHHHQTTPLPQPPRDVHHVHHIPPPPAIPPPQPQDLDLKELLSGFGQPSPNASASHSSSSWATPGANSVAAQLFSMPAVLDHQQMLDDLSLLAAMNYPSKTGETTSACGVLVVLWYTGDLRNEDRWKDSHIRHFEFLYVHGCGGAPQKSSAALPSQWKSQYIPACEFLNVGKLRTASGVVWNWDFDSLTWFCLDFSDEEALKRQVLDLFGTPEWMKLMGCPGWPAPSPAAGSRGPRADQPRKEMAKVVKAVETLVWSAQLDKSARFGMFQGLHFESWKRKMVWVDKPSHLHGE